MATYASSPAAPEEWVRHAALQLAGALAGCDERALLDRTRDGRRDPTCLHGPIGDRLPLAMTLALLRPMRLLAVTGAGLRFVGELPFTHVDAAVTACVDLAVDGDVNGARNVRAWTVRQQLGPWTTDASTWRQRLAQARARLRAVSAEAAFAACQGRMVVAARAAQLPTGPLDGADGVELIFEDGSVAMVGVATAGPPAFLLGSRLALSQLHTQPTWLFLAPSGARVGLTLAAVDGVAVQPSPLAA